EVDGVQHDVDGGGGDDDREESRDDSADAAKGGPGHGVLPPASTTNGVRSDRHHPLAVEIVQECVNAVQAASAHSFCSAAHAFPEAAPAAASDGGIFGSFFAGRRTVSNPIDSQARATTSR